MAKQEFTGKRMRWLAVALVYFALCMCFVPANAAGARHHATGLSQIGMWELGALALSMVGMVLFVHGIFRTHPGRSHYVR